MKYATGPFEATNITATYALSEMQLDSVCAFIQSSYWGGHLSREKIKQSFRYSSCVRLLADGQQVGFARAVSDRETCAYIKDLFVIETHQGRGFGRKLMQGLLDHPDLRDVSKWYLGTKDAHAFYKAFGFKAAPDGIYMHMSRSAAG